MRNSCAKQPKPRGRNLERTKEGISGGGGIGGVGLRGVGSGAALSPSLFPFFLAALLIARAVSYFARPLDYPERDCKQSNLLPLGRIEFRDLAENMR